MEYCSKAGMKLGAPQPVIYGPFVTLKIAWGQEIELNFFVFSRYRGD